MFFIFFFHFPDMHISYNETNQEIELKASKSQEAMEAHKEDSFLLFTTTKLNITELKKKQKTNRM